MNPAVLLDTCALIWVAEGTDLKDDAATALDAAWQNGAAVAISAISAWEVGLLVARRRLAMSVPPQAWFRRVAASPGVVVVGPEPDILIDSSFLPGTPPRDPADRIILATARALGLPVMTRDKLILDYAEAGHIAVIPC
jgi:PIN domain nuclease of toxin-antitoxin system